MDIVDGRNTKRHVNDAIVLAAVVGAFACSGDVMPADGGGGIALAVVTAQHNGTASLDQGRIVIDGPTPQTRLVAPGTTTTIDGLQPGTYRVSLEGLTAGEVELFGQQHGVVVTAGRTTPATVTLNLFVPILGSLPTAVDVGQDVVVQFTSVANAAGYTVEWAADPAFTNAQSTTTASTVVTIRPASPGNLHVRVRARNNLGSIGRASPVRTVDVQRIATLAELQTMLGWAFNQWRNTQRSPVAELLSELSFQHSRSQQPPAGAGAFSGNGAPRGPVQNNLYPQSGSAVSYLPYNDNMQAADSLRFLLRLLDSGKVNAGAQGTAMRAFARLVQGLIHGSIALLYERGFIIDETVTVRSIADHGKPYADVYWAARGHLESAISLASGSSFTTPGDWAGVPLTAASISQLASSYLAVFSALAARTPAEREAVDWQFVMARAQQGITSDFVLPKPGATWASRASGAMAGYFIDGMADQTGAYQIWMATPIANRQPAAGFFSRDARYPTSTHIPGSIIALDLSGSAWVNPGYGTWRWTPFVLTAHDAQLASGSTTLLSRDMMTLLIAEAMFRFGDLAAALANVNAMRTRHLLAPSTFSSPNPDCVPKGPTAQCGDLFEVLKWEARHASRLSGPFLASWFFNGRGWGDLMQGTILHLPLPCNIAVQLAESCQVFGGAGGNGAAPVGTYGY